MQPQFLIFISFVFIQRFIELGLARRNAIWMKERGGVEFGAAHYPLVVLIHVLFLVSLTVEVIVFKPAPPLFLVLFYLTIFILAQIGRWWIIRSLGRWWNTRIFVLPRARVIRRGPYRWLRHPNYVVVMLEFISAPLIFGALFTAVFFSVLNFIVLRCIRIPVEERALSAMTNYEEEMEKITRLVPRRP